LLFYPQVYNTVKQFVNVQIDLFYLLIALFLIMIFFMLVFAHIAKY